MNFRENCGTNPSRLRTTEKLTQFGSDSEMSTDGMTEVYRSLQTFCPFIRRHVIGQFEMMDDVDWLFSGGPA